MRVNGSDCGRVDQPIRRDKGHGNVDSNQMRLTVDVDELTTKDAVTIFLRR
jgi:plastocyanin domain-containing protein